MKYLLFAFSLLLFVACDSGSNKTPGISGNIENGAGKNIELNHIKNNSNVQLESVEIGEKGEFTFNEKPGKFDFYTLAIGEDQIILLTDSTESIEITGNLDNLLGTYDITGSEHSKVLRDYYAGSNDFRQELDSIQKTFQSVAQTGDAAKQQELVDAFESVRGEYQEYQREFLMENSTSPACISILGELDPEENLDIYKKVQSGIRDQFSDHLYFSMLSNQIAEAEKRQASSAKLQPGNVAPEIELDNPEGKTIPLSSLRGKVVLIDFWASWCKPCRRENPNVVKMYNELKDDGFEIYGVSLDRDKGKWVQAIKQDGLTWPQVSDLQFWNSAAAQLYNVSSIPHTVLVDREGKIIASGLRGQALEAKVKESLAM